jgi:cardiolipin synthase
MMSWSFIKIFHSGDDYFQSLLHDIISAKKSITIESYIFNIDKLTEDILDELGRATARGCIVKIVADGFGSYKSIPQLFHLCSQRGIELRVFHPFPYPVFLARSRAQNFSSSLNFILKHSNRRTHRKITIIDEKRAYLGSFNFTQEHSEKISGARAWRDTGVAIEGPPIPQLVKAFQITYMRTFIKNILTWAGRWKQTNDPFQDILRLNSTNKSRRQMYRNLLQRISQAESRIYLTTAYFLPKRSLLKAILRAAKKGIDIKILIPGKSDTMVVKWAAFFIVRLLLKRKIPIFEFQRTILHAKTMIIDNDVFIGSFNLNHRSILHDLEVEVVLKDDNSLENMLKQWGIDIAQSKPIQESDYRAPSYLHRLIYSIAFKLRYML